MEYQEVINLLYNTKNQSSSFRTKNWVKIHDARNTKRKIYISRKKTNIY